MQSHGKSTSAMNDSHSTKIHTTALRMGVGSEHGEIFQRSLIVLCGDRVWRGNRIMDSPALFEKIICVGGEKRGGDSGVPLSQIQCF